MAAILEPHRHPIDFAPRHPEFRVLAGGRSVSRSAPPSGLDYRAVIAALLLLFVVIVGSVAVGRGALAGLAPAPSKLSVSTAHAGTTGVVVVQPGDSLWSIARRVQPVGDVRSLVDQLASSNGSAVLQPGDRIVLPG